VEDVNSDGDLDLLFQLLDGSVCCYSALSATLLWQHQLSRPGSTTLDLRLVDIDNDLHVVIATADDGLVCRVFAVVTDDLTVPVSSNESR